MSLASRPEIEQFGGTPAMVREAMDRLSRVHGDLSMAQTKGYAELLARFVTAASLRAIEAGRSTEGE
jgi:hypothetical protein